ncbi:MAG: vWA domain-containing protein [Polyangiales bacterium]
MYATSLTRTLHSLRLVFALALPCALPACGGSDTTVSADADEDREPPESERVDAGSKPRPDAGTKKPDAARPDAGSTKPPPDEPMEEECAAIEKTTPAGRTAVDVIFVIDTSGSMSDERDKVRANLAAFMADFESTPADMHVVVVTEGDPASATVDRSKYRFVNARVDSKLLYTVAGATLPLYADSLRPNAVTHMIFISDDNDIFPGDAFKAAMEDTLGHPFTFHAIVGTPQGGCSGLSFGGAIGTNYTSLAEATGGMNLEICTEDYSEVFGQLKNGIVDGVPLPCDYTLAEAQGGDFDATKVQMVHTPEGGEPSQFPKASSREACGDKPGWHYDDETNPTTVNLCPAACEAVRTGGTIQIVLGCPPDIVLI